MYVTEAHNPMIVAFAGCLIAPNPEHDYAWKIDWGRPEIHTYIYI